MSSGLDFCPVLDEIYTTRKIVGRTGKVFKVGALTTLSNVKIIRSLMLDLKPTSTLEIGTGFGGSALAIAYTHRDLGIPGAKHVCVEPCVTTWDEAAICALERANLQSFVEIKEDYSYYVLPTLCKEGYKFDMIYIDGSHIFDDAFIDFYYSHELLKIGGVMLFDDSTTSHVAKVTNFIRKNYCPSIFELLSLAAHVDQQRRRIYKIAELLHRQQLSGFVKRKHERLSWNAKLINF
jgi:predicted O-methyltransferase YrrM